MKNVLLLILLLAQTAVYSQKKIAKDNFNIIVREEIGDLNNDGRKDKLILSMDTVNTTVPFRLQIFLSQSDRTLKLHISSTDIVEAQYPVELKGKHSENQIPTFTIENGKLYIISDIKDGHAEYTFQYKNGNFELIHVSKGIWYGKNTTTETEFDALTGIKTEIVKALGSEKIIRETKTTIKLKSPLRLQDLKTLESKY
ncbi:hypothetical protein [Chryseobacterium paridis]|uniref:VCBS repeat-containing protein n=1 Tax=Chryseobacterium paridis TaxID=2800328 RepID=A0ABS1FVF9_9FLAO|nr:hypothetical protein [Chryseobacterium paridis]MBK1896416.1 hypothetical protein [Chryseobacterium paridis]